MAKRSKGAQVEDEPVDRQIETPEEIADNIIAILSKSAYTSFSHALREIVSNAYDADARVVQIRTTSEGRGLRISDDGFGMDREEFRSRYARIAAPKDLVPSRRTPRFARKPIGKFGIGHLAIAPVCARARVVTTKGRGKPVFEAVLDYEEYLDKKNLSRPLSEVYRYFASELPKHAIQEFEGAPARAMGSFTIIELEQIADEISKELRRKGLSLVDHFESIGELSGMARLSWELGIIAPVPYVEGGPVAGYSGKVLDRIVRDLREAHFGIRLDDRPVKRPVRLPAFSKKFKEAPKLGLNYQVFPFVESLPEHGLKFRGYVFNQSSQIVPRELRGIVIRVRGVAIGLYRPDFIGAKTTSSVFRDSTTGELYVDEGLDDAITLDRANFKDTDPAFQALRRWLSGFLDKVRTDYWARGRRRQTARHERKAALFSDRLTDGIADVFGGPAAPPAFALKSGRTSNGRPCSIDTATGAVRLDPHHKVFRHFPSTGKERQVLQVCLYALEVAKERAKGDADRLYAEALSVIEELLDRIYD